MKISVYIEFIIIVIATYVMARLVNIDNIQNYAQVVITSIILLKVIYVEQTLKEQNE